MILNDNFDKSIESIINTCKPLADWFERNQEQMAYFELTQPGCLHFEGTLVNDDILALERMANAALCCLCIEAPQLSAEDKAVNAAVSIALMYEQEEYKLSTEAKIKYYINVENIKLDAEKKRKL